MRDNLILEVKNLSVILDDRNIISNISFQVKEGEAMAIIGPNGAGKTMLLRALLGLISFTGEARWREGVRVGYVPQKFFIERSLPLSVKEFFLLKSKNFWISDKKYLKHIKHELDLVGLTENILPMPLGRISGGELQRVLIAWAMINHPEALLFDEPTTGIDIGSEETIYTLIHRLQDERGTAVLLISHDLNIVYKHAETVLCLNQKMICHGRPRDVLKPEELTKLYGEGGFYLHKDAVK